MFLSLFHFVSFLSPSLPLLLICSSLFPPSLPVQVNYTLMDVYGLGNVRSREEYMAFSYVDLDEETAVNRCVEIARDVPKRVPLHYVPELKYKGYTPDPHPSIMN